ncbi:MAG: hypothetical protein WBC09_05360 [Thermoanaerobaculia bacterium]
MLLLAAFFLLSCAGSPPPVLAPALDSAHATPVILVPGATGVELRDPATGKFVWGKGSNLIRPHDGCYAVALPIEPGAAGTPGLETGDVMEEIRLAGLFRKPVYGPVVDLLVANGYQQGDLADPRPDDTFFLFAYDWRQDNVVSAALLLERLETLRRVRGTPRLPVVLICQSNGAHICRYLAKYGGVSLAEAETGRAERPASIVVEKMILVGSSNGGSLRILREFDRGRSYVSLVGRKWQPETLFTFRSLFQDLPAYRSDLFLDEQGEAMEVDLYDGAAWQTFGWSVFAKSTARRLKDRSRADLFGNNNDRIGYLQQTLDAARRFQKVLAADSPGFGKPDYYLIQNRDIDTPERAVLVEKKGEWKTLFTGDRWLEKRPHLKELATTEGDGHAGIESQLWLSPQEHERLVGEPFQVEGGHFDLILNPAAQEQLLQILTESD